MLGFKGQFSEPGPDMGLVDNSNQFFFSMHREVGFLLSNGWNVLLTMKKNYRFSGPVSYGPITLTNFACRLCLGYPFQSI